MLTEQNTYIHSSYSMTTAPISQIVNIRTDLLVTSYQKDLDAFVTCNTLFCCATSNVQLLHLLCMSVVTHNIGQLHCLHRREDYMGKYRAGKVYWVNQYVAVPNSQPIIGVCTCLIC